MHSYTLCKGIIWFLLSFFTTKLCYIAAQSAVVLKAESLAEKNEWINKLKNVISSKGGQVIADSGPPVRQSLSEGSLVSSKIWLYSHKFFCWFGL